ncbi:MAG TPA: hypothetical protein VEZ72_17290 [Paenibacillus sp.]|nr:hypothetical protein [Paenibacillus sp.]
MNIRTFHIIYVIGTLGILFFVYTRFGELKLGVLAFLAMTYRLMLASRLKVGFANVGNLAAIHLQNKFETIYLTIVGICVIPVWVGYFALTLARDGAVLDSGNNNIFILFIALTGLAALADVGMFRLKKTSRSLGE